MLIQIKKILQNLFSRSKIYIYILIVSCFCFGLSGFVASKYVTNVYESVVHITPAIIPAVTDGKDEAIVPKQLLPNKTVIEYFKNGLIRSPDSLSTEKCILSNSRLIFIEDNNGIISVSAKSTSQDIANDCAQFVSSIIVNYENKIFGEFVDLIRQRRLLAQSSLKHFRVPTSVSVKSRAESEREAMAYTLEKNILNFDAILNSIQLSAAYSNVVKSGIVVYPNSLIFIFWGLNIGLAIGVLCIFIKVRIQKFLV